MAGATDPVTEPVTEPATQVPAAQPTACPLDCPDACGVLAETDAEGRLVRVRGNPAHGWSRGALCGKTALYHELVHAENRLLRPLVRDTKSEPFREASWDEALDLCARRLGELAGHDVLALPYGGTMGLVQRKYPLRVLNALGATLHDGGICDATSAAGYAAVLGREVGLDLEQGVASSDLVLIWGADIARTMQHLQPALQRLCRAGVPVVAIDIWRSDTIRKLERWGGYGIVIEPGTDALLALTLARLLFENDAADRAFLERECLGATEFEAHVRGAHELAECSAVTGVDTATISQLAERLATARTPFVKVGIGWTRRRNGAMGMRAVCSLAAVLGAADRVHYESGDHFGLPEEPVTRPDLRPATAPVDAVHQVALGRTLEAGRFRAAVVWSHNPAVTIPDSAAVRRGLAREDLFVLVHDHFVTETAELANVVLPSTTFVEHADLYRSYGHRRLQRARKIAAAPQAAGASSSADGPRSNVETFAELGRRIGLAREVWDVSAEGLIDELLTASAERFRGDELARLNAGEPVKLHARPHGVGADWGTPSGRVELVSESARAQGQPALACYVPDDAAGDRGRFWLISAPSVHTHNSTFVHSARHVAKAWGRKDAGDDAAGPQLFMHPDAARSLGVREGQAVVVHNRRGRLTLPVAFTQDVPQTAVRVDGLPPRRFVPEGEGINALTSPELSDLGDGSVMYSARVDLEPVP